MHIPFIVKAHLLQGAAFDTRFGVGLDALLASQIRRKEKFLKGLSGRELDGGLAVGEVKIVELPLDKCEIDEELWHWESSMAQIMYAEKPSQEEEVSSFIQHTDIHALEQASNLEAYPSRISEQKGRYRARKTPLVKTLGDTAIWHAIGDPGSVYDLLEHIPSIGQRRTAGEGTIQYWEVEEVTPDSNKLFSHSHDNENLSRPCSQKCLDAITEKTDITLSSSAQRVGFRPPYWHFGNMENMQAPPFRFS